MTVSGIYIIRNLESRKIYIGSAVDLDRRKEEHYKRLRGGYHENPHLQNSWNKYGADAFEFKVLIRCDINDLLHCEQRAMDIYRKAIGWDMMFNVNPTASSRLGAKHSAEAKAKMSAAHKRRKPLTAEARANISAAAKGRKFSPETRAKLSAANKGKRLSPEHRAKLSAAHKGKKLSPEHKAKISATLRNKKP